MIERRLIVNADDFGASEGINRGIVECHERGILTSTSLMVTGAAVGQAIELARAHPDLAIGLHWDVWGEDEREFDTSDIPAVREEFARQLEEFRRLMDRDPTHVDSHRHAHRTERLMPVFEELVAPLAVPLRGDGTVTFVGGFYAQWEWGVTELEHVSVPALQRMLREEVAEGWTEFSCHPGYPSPGYGAMYLEERVEEVRTLADPRVRETIEELGIRLCSYADVTSVARG
jgi:chitin disaccharide deacetylase